MVVLVVENAPQSLRGELTRWMIEPQSGVYVGALSGMVRDKLWEKVKGRMVDGVATLVFNSNTEQGFAIRTHGEGRRQVVDFDGLMLISVARLPKGDRVEATPGNGSSGKDESEKEAE